MAARRPHRSHAVDASKHVPHTRPAPCPQQAGQHHALHQPHHNPSLSVRSAAQCAQRCPSLTAAGGRDTFDSQPVEGCEGDLAGDAHAGTLTAAIPEPRGSAIRRGSHSATTSGVALMAVHPALARGPSQLATSGTAHPAAWRQSTQCQLPVSLHSLTNGRLTALWQVAHIQPPMQ